MTECALTPRLVSAALDDQAARPDAAHVAGCPTCASALRRVGRLDRELRAEATRRAGPLHAAPVLLAVALGPVHRRPAASEARWLLVGAIVLLAVVFAMVGGGLVGGARLPEIRLPAIRLPAVVEPECDAAFRSWVAARTRAGEPEAEAGEPTGRPVDPAPASERELERRVAYLQALERRLAYALVELRFGLATFQACSAAGLRSANERILVQRGPGDPPEPLIPNLETTLAEWCGANRTLRACQP